MKCSTEMNAYGVVRYSGFARHKEPQLDAAGALADVLQAQSDWLGHQLC